MRFYGIEALLLAIPLALTACGETNQVVTPTSDWSGLSQTDGLRGAPPKVPLCHSSGKGTYVPISVPAAAELAHRAHGDAGIGETVPGSPSMVFDENCVPVSLPTITAVTVTPQGATIDVGQTLQMAAAVSMTGGTGTPTIAWSSSNFAIATVSVTGLVTGVAPGFAGITATATLGTSTGSGSATVSVQTTPYIPPTISIGGITNTVPGTGEVPVNLAAVAGQINVTLNLERNGNPVTAVELLMDGSVVASQGFSSSGPLQASPELVPEIIILSVNTAAFNPTTGVPAFFNLQHTLSARVILVGGLDPAVASSVQMTLANISGLVFGGLTNTNNNSLSGVALPSFAINPSTGLAWTAGNHVVALLPVSYTQGVTVASAVISFLGRSFNVNLAQGAATQITYSNGGPEPDIAGYQSPQAGESPVIASAMLSNGQPGPTTVLNSMIPPLPSVPALPVARVDNDAPDPPAAGANPMWMGATTPFTPATMDLIVGADNGPTGIGVNAVAARFFVGASLSGSSGTCDVSGLMAPTVGADLSETFVNNAYRVRVVTYDALGNQICVDLPNSFGVDLTAPTGSISGPADHSAAATIGATWSFVGSDNASGFIATPVSGIITRLSPDGSTTCILGSGSGCSVEAAAPMAFDAYGGTNQDGYYRFDPIHLLDQAGNALSFNGRTYLLDQSPAGFVGGIVSPALLIGNAPATFAAMAVDNLDLGTLFGSVSYPAATLQYPTVAIGAYGPPLERNAFVEFTVPSFIRCLNPDEDYTSTANKPNAINLFLSDFAQVSPTSSDGLALPPVQVADCGIVADPGTFLSVNQNVPDYGPAKTQVDIDGAALAPASSSAVTLRIVADVSLISSDPFSRMLFYYQNITGNWVEIGQGTVTLSQTPTNRFYTYTFVWDPDGSIPIGVIPVVGIGVDNLGDAVMTDARVVTVVP